MAQLSLNDLDPRMTEETKSAVIQINELASADVLINADINLLRAGQKQLDLLRNKELIFENIEQKEFKVKNKNDGYEVPVTAYIPKTYAKNRPIVVFIHGGGFVFFTRQTYHPTVATLAQNTKSIWLSVEYRLSPEYKFPSAFYDSLSVVEWVANNKTTIFDCDQNASIGICGDSAGGNLAAGISHELKHLISFQILVFPVLRNSLISSSFNEFDQLQYIVPKRLIAWFKKCYLRNSDEENDPRVAPLLFENFNGLPKCLIVAAELDPLIDDSKDYVKKLSDTNIQHKFHIINGTVHGFFVRPYEFKNAFNECNNQIVDFLKNI